MKSNFFSFFHFEAYNGVRGSELAEYEWEGVSRELRDLRKLPEQRCRRIFTLPKIPPEKVGL